MTNQTTTKTPLTPGLPLTWPIPNSTAVIVVTRNHDGSVNVTVWAGANRCDGWTYTFPTVAEARREATRARNLFTLHRTAEQIENRRAELTAQRDDQHRRQLRRMGDPTLLAAIDAELDGMVSFGDHALLATLRADLTDRYAA